MLDANSLNHLLEKIKPDEIYNLAAQSHVGVSFELPNYTAQVNSLGALNILQSIYDTGLANKTKFYQASTSELFGEIQDIKQSEKTKFYPKVLMLPQNFLHIGLQKILESIIICLLQMVYIFNHESPRRGETFVKRKITIGLSKIIFGVEK